MKKKEIFSVSKRRLEKGGNVNIKQDCKNTFKYTVEHNK